MLWFVGKIAFTFFAGFYTGKRICPNIVKINGIWYIEYNLKSGCRNRKEIKLFNGR